MFEELGTGDTSPLLRGLCNLPSLLEQLARGHVLNLAPVQLIPFRERPGLAETRQLRHSGKVSVAALEDLRDDALERRFRDTDEVRDRNPERLGRDVLLRLRELGHHLPVLGEEG